MKKNVSLLPLKWGNFDTVTGFAFKGRWFTGFAGFFEVKLSEFDRNGIFWSSSDWREWSSGCSLVFPFWFISEELDSEMGLSSLNKLEPEVGVLLDGEGIFDAWDLDELGFGLLL